MDLYLPVLEKLIAGFIIGSCIGLTGIGGGVLVLPTLTILFGMPPTVTVGTANLYAFLCKLSATYHHWKQRTIAFRTSACILAGAIPANLAVALLVTWYAHTVRADPHAWQNLQSGLQKFIACVVITSSFFILLSIRRKYRGEKSKDVAQKLHALKKGYKQVATAVVLGIVVGGLIAATSVGGGVLIIPILIIVFGLSSVRTVGSSVFIGLVLTLLSAIIYAGSSQMDFQTAIVMAVGSLAGVPIGAKFSKRLPDLLLQILIGGIVLLAGVMMIFGQFH